MGAGSLGRFRPAPGVVLALLRFIADRASGPSAASSGRWRWIRTASGRSWVTAGRRPRPTAWTVPARRACGQPTAACCGSWGTKTIPPEDLARIAVPTALIWGRHDLGDAAADRRDGQRPLRLALYVIEDAGHFTLEQPEASLAALRVALGDRT